jgi:hypothetical protein
MYTGSDISTKLKISGVDVFSAGEFDNDEDESDTFTTIETVPSTVTKQPLNQQPSRNVSQHIPQTKKDSVEEYHHCEILVACHKLMSEKRHYHLHLSFLFSLVEKVLIHPAHCLYCLV